MFHIGFGEIDTDDGLILDPLRQGVGQTAGAATQVENLFAFLVFGEIKEQFRQLLTSAAHMRLIGLTIGSGKCKRDRHAVLPDVKYTIKGCLTLW